MTQPVCLVTGVGPGTGKAIAARLAAGGYRVAMIARDGDRLAQLEREIPNSRGFACDVAREWGPKGIHVAYFIIDAAIDTPRTRPILAPNQPDDFFAKPAAIAEEIFRVAHQDRSTWSFAVEFRPFGETW